MEEQVKNRLQAEKVAHGIVLDCIEAPCIDPNALISDVMPNISRQHYEDIEIERSISNMCGYLCCSKALPSKIATSAQFKIDNESKKVFDITNRAKFCSDWCFAASKCIHDQIPETPIWVRKDEEKKNSVVSLYPKNARGLPGEEVILNELAEELKEINLGDAEDSSESFRVDLGNCSDDVNQFENEHSRKGAPRKVEFLSDPVVLRNEDEIDDEVAFRSQSRDVTMHSLYCSLCDQLFSWRTPKTIEFLTDQSASEALLDEEFCLRIAHFYSKNQSLDAALKTDKQIMESAIIVPNIDSKNQAKERREIVLRAISKYFRNIASSSDILQSSKETWTRICKLVETFSLKASNVFVDPRSSELLLVVLLSILSNVDSSLISKLDQLEEWSISVYKRFGYCNLNELENLIAHFWKI